MSKSHWANVKSKVLSCSRLIYQAPLKRYIGHSRLISLDGVSHCPLVRVVAECNWRADNLKLIKLKTVFSLTEDFLLSDGSWKRSRVTVSN